MSYLINLMNFKKVTAVAIGVGIAACLVAEPAQAGIGKVSGGSTNQRSFTFDLNTDVSNAGNNSVGQFPGAIQNFNIFAGGSSPLNLNSAYCGNDPCPPGNVTVTKLTTDSDGKISDLTIGSEGQKISLDELQPIFTNNGSNLIDLSKDILRYDITFVGTSPEPELIWFIESNDSSLINDLSGLNGFNNRIYGIYPRDVDVNNVNASVITGRFSFTLEVPPQQVPEPTAGLLSVGVLGALALLKRNKRLKNPV